MVAALPRELDLLAPIDEVRPLGDHRCVSSGAAAFWFLRSLAVEQESLVPRLYRPTLEPNQRSRQ
jgi:hypothetical protein